MAAWSRSPKAFVFSKSRSASEFTDFGCCATREELDSLRASKFCNDVQIIYPTPETQSGQQVLNYQLANAVNYKDVAGIQELVKAGADLNAKHKAQYGPPIVLAARFNGYSEISDLVLALGADINHQGAEGNTPLIWAVDHSSLRAVEFLVNRGAKVNLQNRAGKTALYYATANKLEEIVQFLQTHGATANAIETPREAKKTKGNLSSESSQKVQILKMPWWKLW